MNIAPRAPRLASRRLDLAEGRVDLTHGAGGRAMQQLIEEIFRPAFAFRKAQARISAYY